MKRAKEDTGKESNVSQNTEENLKETEEKKYPSVFSSKTPSKDLKMLKGNNRSFQATK